MSMTCGSPWSRRRDSHPSLGPERNGTFSNKLLVFLLCGLGVHVCNDAQLCVAINDEQTARQIQQHNNAKQTK